MVRTVSRSRAALASGASPDETYVPFVGDHLEEQSSSILYGPSEAPRHPMRLDDRQERLLLATAIDGFRTLLAELDPDHRREDSRAQLLAARRYCEILEARLRDLGKGPDLRQLNEWNPEGRIYEAICAGLEEAARLLDRQPPREDTFSIMVGAYIELKARLEKIESRAATREVYWVRWSYEQAEGNAPGWKQAEDG